MFKQMTLTLEDMASITTGLSTIKRYKTTGDGAPWRVMRSIHQGTLEVDTIHLALTPRVTDRVTLHAGDLLVTGKFHGHYPLYLVTDADQGAIATQMVLIVRSLNSNLTPMLNVFLRSAEGQKRLQALAQNIHFRSPHHSPLKYLSVSTLKTLAIPQPQHWNSLIHKWTQLQNAAHNFEQLCQKI